MGTNIGGSPLVQKEKAGRGTQTSHFSCHSHFTQQEMANHTSMHLSQACIQTKTNKLKSTSEVTLQDSNLEVYWQRGKRPGLVHGRHSQSTPSQELAPRQGLTGEEATSDRYTSTPRLAPPGSSLFKSLHLLEQVDTLLSTNRNIGGQALLTQGVVFIFCTLNEQDSFPAAHQQHP